MMSSCKKFRCYWLMVTPLLLLLVASAPSTTATPSFTSTIHSHAKTSPASFQLSTQRPTQSRNDLTSSSAPSSSSLALISMMGIREFLEQRNIGSVLKVPRGGGPRENKGKNQKGKGGRKNALAQPKNLSFALFRMAIESSLGILLIFMGESSSLEVDSSENLRMTAGGVACMVLLLIEITSLLGEDAVKLVSAATIMTASLFLLQP